jgi:hypothetical protein
MGVACRVNIVHCVSVSQVALMRLTSVGYNSITEVKQVNSYVPDKSYCCNVCLSLNLIQYVTEIMFVPNFDDFHEMRRKS